MAEEETEGTDDDATESERDGEYGENRSETDAMGNDKRRVVIGQQYGATLRKRLLVYGAVVAFIAVVAIVFLTVVTNYDNRDMPLKDTAPWTQAGASQSPPRDADFKANGPTPSECPAPCSGDETLPANEIVNR